MTIPVKIKGESFVITLGEFGAGRTPKGRKAACAAGLPPFATVQIFSVANEQAPALVNKLRLEATDPATCNAVSPEIDTVTGFIYDVHMCTVDNRDEATTLACGYFQSGVRVYDIRDIKNVKEIAYFNPAANGTTPIGWCGSLPFLDATSGMLYSWCADAGVMSLKFRNGVWPFPESKTPVDRQL
jgi:hypothetical protein